MLIKFYFCNAKESSLSDIIEDYDTDYVRQSLRKYGYPPGPLVPSTKQLYVRKLNRIIKDGTELKNYTENIKSLNGIFLDSHIYIKFIEKKTINY